MPKSEAYANSLLDGYFGSGSPATLYIGLYTASPNADGTGGTEVTGGSYARKAITNNTTNWPAASARQKKNGTAIAFVQATALWGTIEAGAVFEASSGGTPKYFQDLVTPKLINNGDTFSFAVDQFVITEL